MLIVVSDISDVNLIVLSKPFTDLSNRAFYSVSDCVPEGEDIVNVSFPHQRFSKTLSWVSVSILATKMLAKAYICSLRQSISFKNFVGTGRSFW